MSCNCNNHKNGKKIGTLDCSSLGGIADHNKNTNCDCQEDVLVEIIGICPESKLSVMETGDTWTQIFIPEVLCVPSQKPDIEEIATVTARIEIISQRVVKTPSYKCPCTDDAHLGCKVPVSITNNEGTVLTGRKLVIEGILRQKVVYTANVDSQSMHSAHFDVPFSAFIVLPPGTSTASKYKIETCIEDIFVCRITDRQVFKNVTIFIKATNPKTKICKC